MMRFKVFLESLPKGEKVLTSGFKDTRQFKDYTLLAGAGQKLHGRISSFWVVADTAEGEEVGGTAFVWVDDHFEAEHIIVKSEFARQGIATAIYKFANDLTGGKIKKSHHANAGGDAIWKKMNDNKSAISEQAVKLKQNKYESAYQLEARFDELGIGHLFQKFFKWFVQGAFDLDAPTSEEFAMVFWAIRHELPKEVIATYSDLPEKYRAFDLEKLDISPKEAKVSGFKIRSQVGAWADLYRAREYKYSSGVLLRHKPKAKEVVLFLNQATIDYLHMAKELVANPGEVILSLPILQVTPAMIKESAPLTAKKAEDKFIFGDCGAFAIALQQEIGGEIYSLNRDGKALHAFVKKDGKNYDVKGQRGTLGMVLDIVGSVEGAKAFKVEGPHDKEHLPVPVKAPAYAIAAKYIKDNHKRYT